MKANYRKMVHYLCLFNKRERDGVRKVVGAEKGGRAGEQESRRRKRIERDSAKEWRNRTRVGGNAQETFED